MRHRRLARERAVQFLFQHDLNPPENPEEALGKFWISQTSAAIEEDKKPAEIFGDDTLNSVAGFHHGISANETKNQKTEGKCQRKDQVEVDVGSFFFSYLLLVASFFFGKALIHSAAELFDPTVDLLLIRLATVSLLDLLFELLNFFV